MNILLLVGDNEVQYSSIRNFLVSRGHAVKIESGFVDADYIFTFEYDFLISYGYRHKITREVLDMFFQWARINLHISLLPWCGGADPNLWSWLEDTPKGVTIHCLNEGIDTGDILLQVEKSFPDRLHQTLATSYSELHRTLLVLFKQNWKELQNGSIIPRKQEGIGTFHRSADKEPYLHLLTKGWDTPVSVLEGICK